MMKLTNLLNIIKSRTDGRKEEAARAAADALPLPDPETGLTADEVEKRVSLGLINRTDFSGIRSTGQILFSHIFTWFNLLNIFLGALVFYTGQYKHMLFLGVIICNSAIGIFQELKVRSLIRDLSVITAVKVTVRRSAAETVIPVDAVVRDDIICVMAGDQIVADGPVVTTSFLEVNESLLTGESKPLRKEPGDRLLSGSFVVSGSAVMRAEKVGNDCYASGIVQKSKHHHRASSEMLHTIHRIIRLASVAIVPIGTLLFFSQRDAALRTAAAGALSAASVTNEAIVRTVSGVIGMIPEGLVLLTSVSFIIGVGKLAQKRALVQEMEAIEALARSDVIVTDKTGTITTGELRVEKLVSVGDTGAGLIRAVMAHLGGAAKETNDTQAALDRYFGRKYDWPVTSRIPFSSERKFKAAAFSEYGAFVLGAPEYLVPDRRDVLNYVKKHAEKGCRCLLLCSSDGISPEEGTPGQLTPMSVIILSDVIRPDAAETFRRFQEAGVTVKVLSGDDPATVSATAAKAGIPDAELAADASLLPEDPALLREEIERYAVFGRVRPAEKQAFIKALMDAGHTVAMTGDGVNDCLALTEADCGIAMADGAEAARHAAHIVLLDSDFASMTRIIGEGRTIICNIERVSALYLTKMIYASILCVLFILLRTSYPWTALQMGLLNLVGIGMPSFLLTLESHEDWRSGGFLSRVLQISLPSALTMVVTILLVQLCSMGFGWSSDMYSFFSVMLGGMVSLLVVAQVSWPMTPYRKFIFIACVCVFVLAVIFLHGFYDIHSLWTPWSLMLIPGALFIIMLNYGLSLLSKKAAARIMHGPSEDHE